MKKIFAASIILAMFLCGCGEGGLFPRKTESEEESKTERKRESETKPGMIDYITGAEQIKTYKKMKSKIEEIERTSEERYQEFQE